MTNLNTSKDIADALLKKADKASPKPKKKTSKPKRVTVSKNESILSQSLKIHPEGLPVADLESSPLKMYEGNISAYVPGVGKESSDIMFIGEAPGFEEDRQSAPFVGRAGQTLQDCMQEVGIEKDDVWITNIVKERPPENRDPRPAEIMKYMPYLVNEINTVKPKVIVLLGNIPTFGLLNTKGITRIHGGIYTLSCFAHGEVKVIPIFHPSYVMRREDDKVTHLKFIKDLTRIKKFMTGGAISDDRKATKYTLIENMTQFNQLMKKLYKAKIVDFDLETTSKSPENGKIMCVSFSVDPYQADVLPLHIRWKDGQKVEPYNYWGDKHDEVVNTIKTFFESDSVEKSLQAGALIDIPFLSAIGININKWNYDTIIMHHLIDENAKHRSLKDFAWEYTDMGGYDAELDEAKEQLKRDGQVDERGEITFADIPFDTVWPYAAADADVLGRVRRSLWDKMKKDGLTPLFNKISMPVQRVLCKLESNGIKIDRVKLKEIQEEYAAMEVDVNKQLESHPVTERTLEILNERSEKKEITEVNYASTKQLGIALFEVCGLTPIKRSKKTGAPSTDVETLKALQNEHELPRLILQKRSYSYFQKFYGDKFESFIQSDGRVHTNYLVYGTETGRLSSRNPNLQNIPRSDKTGEAIAGRIRDIFIAEPGNVLIDADYSQIEYRLLGNYTQDKQIIQDIAEDRDIHIENAALIFEKPVSDVTSNERQDAKHLTYLMIYGGTIYRIMGLFNVSKDRAECIIDELFARYPGAKKFHDSMKFMACTKGFVQNIFGRRRRLPNILSDDKKTRGHSERQAINAPIQSLAGDILYIAMIRLNRIWVQNPDTAKMVLTVHDSLTHECKEENQDRVIAMIHNEMTRKVPGVTVPIPIEVKVGPSLGKMRTLTAEELAEIVEKNT